MRGKFVTIEGCEGVGKSTQVRFLKEYCLQYNINAVFTREPGGTEIAERIREVILDQKNSGMDGITELLLYQAARREHTLKFILPALDDGKTVFCDRYIDSTTAYQSYARGIDLEIVEYFNKIGSKDIRIDLTLFLNLDSESGFTRKGGADKSDRLENEGVMFHKKVYNGFLETAKKYKDRFALIDVSGDKRQTHEKIIAVLKDKDIFSAK